MNPNIALIIQTVATIGSLIAAWAAWRAAVISQGALRVQSSQVLLSLWEKNSSNEMRDAINELWKFQREASDQDVGVRFAALKEINPERFDKLDEKRRRVHKYFLQLMRLKLANVIPERDFIQFITKSSLETAVLVLKPIEELNVAGAYTTKVFDEYKRLLDNYSSIYKKLHKIDVDKLENDYLEKKRLVDSALRSQKKNTEQTT